MRGGVRSAEKRLAGPLIGRMIYAQVNHKDVLTFVVCSTLISRGKSLTPESRMEMLLLSRWLLERSEETQSASGFAMAYSIRQDHGVLFGALMILRSTFVECDAPAVNIFVVEKPLQSKR